MAIKALNSVAGFSVGEVPANIILANGDITSGNGTFTANISAGNVKTNNLLYANGNPWDIGGIPGGNNTEVQFNDIGEFGGNSNFTFNKTTGVLTVTGNIAGGNINAGNLLTANFLTGTLTTSAQPNITSVGTLTGLTISDGNVSNTVIAYGNGTLAVSGNITANNFVGNVSGNISGNIIIPGSNTGVVFNDNGNANTSTAFTFNKSSNLVTITANANVGNLISGGVVSATGNVSGSNITTGGLVDATGNVSGGNITTVGLVAATGNVSGGNLTTGGVLSVTGNANVGNLGTGGLIVAIGNITGSNLNTLGNANIGNLTISGNVQGSLIPSANVTYDLGNTTYRWKDLYLSGTSIILGDQTLTSNASGISLSNTAFMTTLSVSGNANVGNLGTGGLIVATGNIDGGNLNTGGLVAATGNVSGGNITTVGVVAATGNVSGGNITTSGLVAATGNVSGGNITTVGVVAATGNVSGGNITTGGEVAAIGNIVSNANVVTDLIAGRTSSITITAAGTNQNINLVPTGTGFVNVGNFIISNVATPVASTDAATKQYVDDVAQGLSVHASCGAATPDPLATLSSGTVTYNNGTAGVGATLITTGTYTLIDGVNVASAGFRILVKDEANTAHNGIYTYTNGTTLTRAVDFNTAVEIAGGDFTFVTGGTEYNSTGWVQIDEVTVVGTDPIVWEQFSGAGQYAAGTGLTLTGTTFSITNTTVTAGAYGNGDYNATFTVNSQGQLSAAANVAITANAANLTGTTLAATIVNSSLTSVGTLTSLAVTGNTTSGNVYANAGTIGASLLTGTLTTAAQPNITSVGSLTSLVVSGTSNLGPVGNVTITGGTTGYYLQTNGSGVLTWAAIPVGSGISNGTSNVNIPTVNGNVDLTAGGNTTLVVTSTGANIAGTLNVTGNATVGNLTTSGGSGGSISGANSVSANFLTGTLTTAAQPNITSVGSLTSLIVTGNITSGNANLGNVATANFFVGSGNNLSNIQGGNVSGAVAFATTANAVAGANVSGQVGNALVAGTVYTNAQPNITSTGTLVNLAVSGNVALSGANVSLGAVGNLAITGGTNGQVLTTNGSGGLSFVSISSSSISNGNSNVNIPSANGNVNISAVGNANVLVITGTGANINGTLDVTGNLTAGNFIAGAGTGGNITGANVVSANFFTGTLTTNAQPNITSVGTLNSLIVSGTSNLGPVGNVTITGGVTGYYLQTNGSGVLTWAAIPVGTGISNGTSNVNIPAVNGNVNISVAGISNVLVVTGTGSNIAGTLNVTGNATVANLAGGNLVSANFLTGTLTTAAQPNITSVGTLTSLDVTGNTTSGNVYANAGTIGASLLTGTLTTAAQPNITSVGTLTSLAVTGNLTAGNLIGALANGNSNVNIPAANGNVNISAVGTANVVVVTGTGANIAGTLNVTGNLSAGNLIGALANGNSNVNIPSANGNINLTAVGNTTLVVTGTGANITGTLDVTGNLVAGNITTGGSGGNISGANVVSANILSAAVGVQISNSAVYFGNVTTTSTGANQTIATIALTSSYITGVEYLVKGVDATGTKYSVATVVTVTNGTIADYSTFATVNLGGSTGALAVNISGSNIALQVTPASSNSTVWTTQYRVI